MMIADSIPAREDPGAPLVSIVVPVYNVARFLRHCLKSLASQEVAGGFEVVCVDDGSKDESPRILDEMAQADSRFRVVHQQNAGVSAARNKGIEVARGEYVCFVDGDDILLPGALKHLSVVLRSKAPDCLLYPIVAVVDGEVVEGATPGWAYGKVDGRPENALHAGMSSCNKLIRRKILVDNGVLFPTDCSYGEDFMFVLCAYPFCRSFAYVETPCYGYVQTSVGLSCQPGERTAGMVDCCEYLWDFLCKHGVQQQYRRMMLDFVVHSLRRIRSQAPVRSQRSCGERLHRLLSGRMQWSAEDAKGLRRKDAKALQRLAQGLCRPPLGFYLKRLQRRLFRKGKPQRA